MSNRARKRQGMIDTLYPSKKRIKDVPKVAKKTMTPMGKFNHHCRN